MHHRVHQEALRIDKNVPLFLPALDLLACIVTARIDAGPPFPALATFWLSMMAAVGLASREASSTTAPGRRLMDAVERAVPAPQIEIIVHLVERGGKSWHIARHWEMVLKTYIKPLTTSRTFTVRLLPPRFPAGMSGSDSAHSSSVRLLG